jgi:hypothetical protein
MFEKLSPPVSYFADTVSASGKVVRLVTARPIPLDILGAIAAAGLLEVEITNKVPQQRQENPNA